MPYIHSFKRKILVGAGSGLWLFTFLVFIAPFDASDLSIKVRIWIMVVYGVIFFLGYLLLTFIEWRIYVQRRDWSSRYEVGFYLLLYLLVFFPTVSYYKSGIVNGDYAVFRFFLEQYVPILIIVTPVIFLLRKIAAPKGEKNAITIKGENKRDILRIAKSELVMVSSSDNYIEVSYLNQGLLTKRLLRTTFKKIESELSFLKRVHRSHLINEEHFKEWVGRDTINVAGAIVPVSKKYHGNIPG